MSPHRPVHLALALAGLLVLAGGRLGADEETQPRGLEPLSDALARVVDLPAPDERAAAADLLAAREDLTIEGLLAAMQAFGTFPALEAGPQVHDVPLPLRRVAHTVVYVPKGYDPARPTPLILALHGSGGRGAEMIPWWRALADQAGFLVAAPTDSGANEGFRFSASEREDLLLVLRWLRRAYNVDENRIHLTGVSRGGHLTWDLGVRHPDLWASLSPMIGGPRLHLQEGQNNLRYVENVAHLPIRDLQGRDDDSRMIFNLTLAFRRLDAAGAKDAKLILQSGFGHGFDFEAVDWKTFLGGAARTPVPPSVTRRSARDGEGRAFWVEILETKSPVVEGFTLQVSPTRWGALDDAGRRRFMQKEADKRTARLDARMPEPGTFVLKSSGVKRVRLLLTPAMFDPEERVDVRFGGRRYRRRVIPSKAVLLREFAERFDRTFLPVGELRLP